MSDYRRYWVPGGTYSLTLATYQRNPLFADPANVKRLRAAVTLVQRQQPFQFVGAVILPDHLHFLWTLPPGDCDYAKRIGRTKVLFTRALRAAAGAGGPCPPYESDSVSVSRGKHRESDVWQRRFCEHTLHDEDEFCAHLDYIHYNPVKHGWASCPHAWPASSFHRGVSQGLYETRWGCCCDGRTGSVTLPKLKHGMGEL